MAFDGIRQRLGAIIGGFDAAQAHRRLRGFSDSTLVTQAMDGDPCALEFSYALPSGESFTFTVHAVSLPRPRIEISGPQGVQATFDWQAARDSALGRMCTATLINDREEY